MSRIALLVISFVTAGLLGGCDGGLFGTGTGDNSDIVQPVQPGANSDNVAPGVTQPESNPTPDGSPEAPSSNTAESDNLPITINFSNTTPSGIDQSDVTLPSLKLINLTEFAIAVTSAESQSTNQSVSISPQQTSDLFSVNTGETTVSVRREDNDSVVASLNPLNAAADTMTTLVLETQTLASDSSQQEAQVITSLLALDTQAVVSASGMAEIRIVSTAIADANSVSRNFTLTPTAADSSGAELVLTIANSDNPAVGAYSLANAGSYVLSSNDESISSEPITLLADTVYTIIITRNPQAPVYVEVDSLLSE